MKERLRKIIDEIYKYNSPEMPFLALNVQKDDVFDLVVFAPTYTPNKLKMDRFCEINELMIYPSVSSYLLKRNNHKILWIVVGASDSNQADYLALVAEYKFKKIIFIGAVGALKADAEVGDIFTPTYSINGGMVNTYLKESIKDFVPFEKYSLEDKETTKEILNIAKKRNIEVKEGSVFCTPSVSLEYIHLNEIRSFNTDLIEMETATFMAFANLMEKPAAILLVVSDNSCNGKPIIGRNKELEDKYNKGRREHLASLIIDIVD